MSNPRAGADDDVGVCIVLCTAPTEKVGLALARAAVEQKLAACANLIPGVRSIYVWHGDLCDESEVQMLFKTSKRRVDELTQWLASEHPYDVPELLTLTPEAATEAFGAWVTEQTS